MLKTIFNKQKIAKGIVSFGTMSFLALSSYKLSELDTIYNNIKYKNISNNILFDLSRSTQYFHNLQLNLDNYYNNNSDYLMSRLKILSSYINVKNNYTKNICGFYIMSNLANKNYNLNGTDPVKKGEKILKNIINDHKKEIYKPINKYVNEKEIFIKYYILSKSIYLDNLSIYHNVLNSIHKTHKNIFNSWSPSINKNIRKFYDKNKPELIRKVSIILNNLNKKEKCIIKIK